MLKMTRNPGTKYHSIIGSIRAEARFNTTDGIVPYASAHVDWAESEVVVPSDHGVQKDPIAIREVKSILLKHLDATRQELAGPAARPVGGAVSEVVREAGLPGGGPGR